MQAGRQAVVVLTPHSNFAVTTIYAEPVGHEAAAGTDVRDTDDSNSVRRGLPDTAWLGVPRKTLGGSTHSTAKSDRPIAPPAEPSVAKVNRIRKPG